jgi:nitrogen fixation NifU-like protein
VPGGKGQPLFGAFFGVKVPLGHADVYSRVAQDHIGNLRNVGPPPGANRKGIAGTPGDGPFIAIYLVVEEGRVKSGGYHTYACPAAIACASLTVEFVYGNEVSRAAELTPQDLVSGLGGLPEGKQDRAELAIEALKAALESEFGEP